MNRTFFAGIVVSLFAAGAAVADDAGKEEFMVACAGCHGESGKGDGPLAPMLNIETPSLTGLSAANGGVFPFETAFLTIDGRGGVRAHGSAMPVWGMRFSASAAEGVAPETAELIARGRVLSLVYYLQSIQE